ncbi:MAG: histidine--tRNA ligase [Clostridia bacterium]|nr:histidine--tRNA ligase [Clostridia bacterium]
MLTVIPKGTKDVLPADSYKWQFIEKKFRNMCDRYGFKEIRTPNFEHTELFLRGIGDTTDVVQKEMYTFKDHGDRSITLKPEGTAGVVRAFVENNIYAEVQPTKIAYDTCCYRYEKPQAGRLREFHQFGCEEFGTPNMLADAEIISLAYDFFNELGINDLKLEINSVGCPVCRKNHREALRNYLLPRYDELCDTCKGRFDKNPMRILDCKSPKDQEIVKGAPMMLDYLCDDCKAAFEDLKSNLDAMGISYTVNPMIVRGLDYYTKTAFEFITNRLGAQSAVCAGGRYDNLVEEIGGPKTPGVGFGLGKERLLLLMEAYGIEIPKPNTTDLFIATMGEKAKLRGLALKHTLIKEGLSVQMDNLQRNFKGQFKLADKVKAKYTAVIGDNELEKGVVSLKNMETGEQTEVAFENIVKEIM